MARLFQGITRVLRCNLNSYNRPAQKSFLNDEDKCNTNVPCTQRHRLLQCNKLDIRELYQNSISLKSTKSLKCFNEKWHNYGDYRFHRSFFDYLHLHGIPFETVAWGAVIMLTFHLPSFWRNRKQTHETCLWQDVKQIYITIKSQQRFITPLSVSDVKHYLPGISHEVNQELIKQYTREGDHTKPVDDAIAEPPIKPAAPPTPEFVEFIINEDYSAKENAKHNSPDSQHEEKQCKNAHPTKEKTDQSDIDVACQEWKEVAKLYSRLQYNNAAFDASKNGKEDDALEIWQDLSILNDPTACYNMAICYHQGYGGVTPNENKAVYFYKKAARSGHARSLYNLGILHLEGDGGLNKSHSIAAFYLRQAAMAGLVEAQRELGYFYAKHHPERISEAVRWFEKAAEKQDEESLYYLAMCHQHGLGVKQDDGKALQFYNEAARMGHVASLYSLGSYYETGIDGLPKDVPYAIELYKKAAMCHFDAAQKALERLRVHRRDDDHDLGLTHTLDDSEGFSTQLAVA